MRFSKMLNDFGYIDMYSESNADYWENKVCQY